jgi:hypothetical protein
MWAMLDGQLMGEPWLGNFPNWGTMRNGELIPLSKSEPLITEEGGGFWATPTVNNSKNNAGPSQMDRHGPALDVQVVQWPTPKSARSGPDYARQERKGSGGDDLVTVIGGSLNPDWVSWLMGLPEGWTRLEPIPDGAYDEWSDAMKDGTWWQEERGLPRVTTGIPDRVNRLKMLGNGIVPGTATLAIKELSARLL